MTGRTGSPDGHGDSGARLRAATNDLAAVVTRLATDWWDGRPTPGFRFIGEGSIQVEAALREIEPTARRTVWTMMPLSTFDPENTMNALDAHTIARGVEMRFVTSERTGYTHPLITSEIPHVRFGPASSQFILIDEETAVVAGPLGVVGYPTAWLTTRDDVVSCVRAIWDLAWPLSRPGNPDGVAPPFSPRQCRVARRIVVGAKDAAIARELGVSVRTVAGDVAHLMQSLGAGSRAEVAMLLRGGSDRQIVARYGPHANGSPQAGPRPEAPSM